jgi:hypothetical protein
VDTPVIDEPGADRHADFGQNEAMSVGQRQTFPYSPTLTPLRAGLAAGGGASVAGLAIGSGLIGAVAFGVVLGAVGFVSVRHGKREVSGVGDT